MLKNIFSGLLVVIAILFIPPNIVFADDNFQTDINVEYKILEDGKTTVTNTVTIKNLKSDYFPKKYILNLKGVFPQNVKAYESGDLLRTVISENNGLYGVTVNFDNLSVGRGTTKTFIVSFDDETLAQKTGEIWEILIPKVTDKDNYSSYKVTLSVPDELGDEAYISPEPTSINKVGGRTLYKFENYHDLPSGVTAGFGIFQVFAFTLNYHIDQNGSDLGEITLPPDTSTQKMFYEEINPKPENMNMDIDGNWIATFNLEGSKFINVAVSGFVQIFAEPNSHGYRADKPKKHDLLPTSYWQSDDHRIIDVANSLEDVEEIYNYVVNNLKYNYDRVSESYVRYGSVKALENPDDALCMEFTDLFIALARAKGIPAREINGYAYSQNFSLEPVSLVTDILHSWPEYWNEERGLWIPVDPTWGSTTGGVDFFTKLDLRHFAFVIHSQNPVLPYSAGIYKNSADPKKDIIITFSNLPQRKPLNVKVETLSSFIAPFFINKLALVIHNNGQTALYDFPISSKINNDVNEEKLPVFLPFAKKELTYVLNHGLLGTKTPEFISFTAGGMTENISTDKETIIFGQLLIFMTVLFAIIFTIHFRGHRQLYLKYINSIRDNVRRHVRKLFTTRNY